MRRFVANAVGLIAFAGLGIYADRAFAQSFFRGGTEFNAVRQVRVPGGKTFTIVVVEFYHHGEIKPDGSNVVVAAQNRDLVPVRVLQLGPGDFCRLAFQTIKGQTEYDVFYGGDPPREKPPAWTCTDGLILETRESRPCNVNNRDAVRKAFDEAKPIGADYVDGVFHACNPFSLKRDPFFSRYTGVLNLPKSATYGFITSSQDCSFLSIDDKLVTSAPGYHGPTWVAHRGLRHDIKLAGGPHKFQYDHAAAGQDAMMAVSWEINAKDPKPVQPVVIPSDLFNAQRVAHLTAGPVAFRTMRQPPDFSVKIVGETPLPDDNVPLVRVQFRDISAGTRLAGSQAKVRWDFGDGQTSELANVDHVYLRPGLYTVKLSTRRSGRTVEIVNRVYVNRPLLGPQEKQDSLDDYLGIVENYDAKKLDAASALQLAKTFEAKSLALAIPGHKPKAVEPKRRAGGKPVRKVDGPEAEAERYLEKAVDVGRAAFADDSAAKGDAPLMALARLVGPMARYRLGDAAKAGQIWRGAASRISSRGLKAECEVAAADVAINDLAKPAAAKPMLESATKRLGNAQGRAAAELHRVWGDYYAAVGDGKSARSHYRDAEQAVGATRTLAEQTAWRGAHARSTEEFLKRKQFARAIEELRLWQQEFPADKIDGYWTLLFARYWEGREKFAQAVAQAEQLQAVNPDSPYIDQLLFLAADCEMERDQKDRALATLHGLLKNYPGSPLIPEVKKRIQKLER